VQTPASGMRDQDQVYGAACADYEEGDP